jgi:thioredoxin-related protein
MRILPALMAGMFFIITSLGWGTDIEKAKEKAGLEHKLILLNFSGSDWCGPCIRLHDEIFESDAFKIFADDHLVLVNADFPRMKKHLLPKDLQKKNDLLADKYNKDGAFPYTVLLDANGKIIKTWDGLPQGTAEQFVSQVKVFCDAHK